MTGDDKDTSLAPEFEGRPGLVKQRSRAILATRVVIAILLLFSMVSISLLVFNAVQSIATRAVLLDCTDPTGECYQEGQKRTANLVGDLIAEDARTQRIVVLAAACAQHEEIRSEPSEDRRIHLVEQCVNTELKEELNKVKE